MEPSFLRSRNREFSDAHHGKISGIQGNRSAPTRLTELKAAACRPLREESVACPKWKRADGLGTLADGFFAAVEPSSVSGVIFAASTTDGVYRVEWAGSMTRSLGAPDLAGK